MLFTQILSCLNFSCFCQFWIIGLLILVADRSRVWHGWFTCRTIFPVKILKKCINWTFLFSDLKFWKYVCRKNGILFWKKIPVIEKTFEINKQFIQTLKGQTNFWNRIFFNLLLEISTFHTGTIKMPIETNNWDVETYK